MKRCFLVFIMFFASLCSYAQYTDSNTKNTFASPDSNVNYRLFQTNNRWTFLKLYTRNGIITHVQYSIDGDAFEYPLNTTPLVEGDDAKAGRFFLYPTENTYTYILLDQIDGRVWQVQWSIDKDSRGMWAIIYSPWD